MIDKRVHFNHVNFDIEVQIKKGVISDKYGNTYYYMFDYDGFNEPKYKYQTDIDKYPKQIQWRAQLVNENSYRNQTNETKITSDKEWESSYKNAFKTMEKYQDAETNTYVEMLVMIKVIHDDQGPNYKIVQENNKIEGEIEGVIVDEKSENNKIEGEIVEAENIGLLEKSVNIYQGIIQTISVFIIAIITEQYEDIPTTIIPKDDYSGICEPKVKTISDFIPEDKDDDYKSFMSYYTENTQDDTEELIGLAAMEQWDTVESPQVESPQVESYTAEILLPDAIINISNDGSMLVKKENPEELIGLAAMEQWDTTLNENNNNNPTQIFEQAIESANIVRQIDRAITENDYTVGAPLVTSYTGELELSEAILEISNEDASMEVQKEKSDSTNRNAIQEEQKYQYKSASRIGRYYSSKE